jgi:hypothetical protein
MGYDSTDHVVWDCRLQCTLRNELQEMLRAAGIDHDIPIRDVLFAQYGCVNAHF